MRRLLVTILLLLLLVGGLLVERANTGCKRAGGVLVLTVLPGWACVEVLP